MTIYARAAVFTLAATLMAAGPQQDDNPAPPALLSGAQTVDEGGILFGAWFEKTASDWVRAHRSWKPV